MLQYTHIHARTLFCLILKRTCIFYSKKRISQEKTGKSLIEEVQKQLWTKGLHCLSQGQLLTFDILLNHKVNLIFPPGNRALYKFKIYRASGEDGRRETDLNRCGKMLEDQSRWFRVFPCSVTSYKCTDYPSNLCDFILFRPHFPKAFFVVT